MTSVKELVRSLIEYLDELLRNAVRVTTSCELGTSRNLSFPGYRRVSFIQSPGLERVMKETHQIDNLSKPHFDATSLESLFPRRVVNQF